MTDSRGPGPRGLGSDVKGELLRAGCALYAERGFEPVSLREIADRAGVTQAMVRYYFKDKHGFETAMLDDGFERFVGVLDNSADFRSAIHAAVSTLNTMPWLPLLMMRTVYVSDDLRSQFAEKHAPRIVAALRGVLVPREDLEPANVFLSIISLLVFPQLAKPVVGPVLGIRFDDAFAAGFADHLAKLFQANKSQTRPGME